MHRQSQFRFVFFFVRVVISQLVLFSYMMLSKNADFMNWSSTYHVNDLLQCQTKLDLQGLRFVGNGSLQGVVGGEQVVQQALLVRSLTAFCNGKMETKTYCN